ncbi:DUF4258 domain-containing protein [Thermococcus sp. MAR1]|uniref:DUF4258 domain-containing protein n=1 Tax=Thermococcus sp. MAR1 TaxID=1638263 RepID=UPI00143AC2F2|nr:DUF4258 domain-containing protein [Thermococcus sp. MAR1]NJE10307.1 DUF4258 domain-containing protein [Thermococcus sp. MAR1]
MAEVNFTEHAIEAMKKRNIAPEEAINAIEKAELRAVDTLTGHFVAIKKNGKWTVAVYDVYGQSLEVVTVYRVSRKAQIENRLRKGRWVGI